MPALIPVQCQRCWRWWSALGHSPYARPGDRAPGGGADVAGLRRARGADGGAARHRAQRHPGDAAERHLRGHRRRGVPAARTHLRVGRRDRRPPGPGQPDRLGLLPHGAGQLRQPRHLAVRGRRSAHHPRPAGIDGGGRDQQCDQRADRGMARPRAAAVPGRTAAVSALAAGAGGPARRHGAAGDRRDADPGPLRRAVRRGVEPVRRPRDAWRDGRDRYGRLAARTRRDRGRRDGSGRAPAQGARHRAAPAQARAGRRIGHGRGGCPRYEHLARLAARQSAGPDGRARLRLRRVPAGRRLRRSCGAGCTGSTSSSTGPSSTGR